MTAPTGQKAPDMFTGASVPNPPKVTADGKPSVSTGPAGVPMRRVVGWVAPVVLLVVGAALWSVSPWLTLGMLGAALVVAGVVALAPVVAARRADAGPGGRSSGPPGRRFVRRGGEARGDRWAAVRRLTGRGGGTRTGGGGVKPVSPGRFGGVTGGGSRRGGGTTPRGGAGGAITPGRPSWRQRLTGVGRRSASGETSRGRSGASPQRPRWRLPGRRGNTTPGGGVTGARGAGVTAAQRGGGDKGPASPRRLLQRLRGGATGGRTPRANGTTAGRSGVGRGGATPRTGATTPRSPSRLRRTLTGGRKAPGGAPGGSRWRLPGRGAKPGVTGGANTPRSGRKPTGGATPKTTATTTPRRGWRRVIPWGRPTPSPRSAAGRAAKRKAAERKARREWWFGPTEPAVPPQPEAQPRGKRARRGDETPVQSPSDSKPRPQGKAGRRRGRDDGRQDRRTRQQFPESSAEPIVPGSADDAGFPYIPPPDRSSAGSGASGEMPPAASRARPANYYDVDDTGWPLPAPTTPPERQGRNESMTTTHAGQVDASTIATATATLNDAADAARLDSVRLRDEALDLRAQGAAMMAKDSRVMRDAGARLLAEAGRREVTAQTRVGMAAAYTERAAEVAARG